MIHVAWSESRKSAADAMSSGRPRRPRGTAARSATLSGAEGVPAWLLGVRTVPGATALMRMPSGPHSMAAVRANDMIAAFDAA